MPKKQPKRGRLWLNDGLVCAAAAREWANHTWSYDFVQDRTQDGRAFRMLCIIDEFTRRCPGDRGGSAALVRRRAALPGRPVRRAWTTRAHTF